MTQTNSRILKWAVRRLDGRPANYKPHGLQYGLGGLSAASFNPCRGCNFTVNAGNASIDGWEGTIAYKISDNWEISAATTYLDAQIDEDIVINNGTIIAGRAGDALPVVPEWKTFASLHTTRSYRLMVCH